MGEVYGLPVGQRCNAAMDGKRVEIDHYPLPATDEGSDTLENAVACCTDCHGFKTRTYDVPMQAKSKRVATRHLGLSQPGSLPGARVKYSRARGVFYDRLTGETLEDHQP
jgi:hypothetical protein